MKKILFLPFGMFILFLGQAQNGVYGPAGVYGPQYNAATTIGNGGNVLVGTGGNWYLAGNITSADKGNTNSPTATGRTETITFDNNGSYSNATTSTGATGNVVDGYASSTAAWTGTVLPIGNATRAYAVTIPSGAAVKAAYFDGSGSTQNVQVNSIAATEYSPYIDMPAGFPTGSYTFSYPSGFTNTPFSSLLSSGNTSAAGTNGSTAYSLLATVSAFSATAGTATATLPASTATQVYFSTSSSTLPVTILHFNANVQGNNIVLLSWATSTEQNNSYFAVERSTDGANWTRISSVASKAPNGNSSSPLSYTFNDNQAIVGTDYYRLQQMDFDGRSAYSLVQTVLIGNNDMHITAFPNPASDVTTVSGISAGNTVRLLDAAGKTISTQTSPGNTSTIRLSGYPSGIYLVQVFDKGVLTATLKLVKQ